MDQINYLNSVNGKSLGLGVQGIDLICSDPYQVFSVEMQGIMHLSGYNLDAPHGHVNKEAEEYAIYEPAFCFIFSLFICRYISQKSYEDAIEIVHNGACLFLKHKQVIPVITITEFQASLSQQFH